MSLEVDYTTVRVTYVAAQKTDFKKNLITKFSTEQVNFRLFDDPGILLRVRG